MMGRPTDDVRQGGSGSFRTFVAAFEDAVLLLLVAFLFPLMILVIGAPIALLMWALTEIAQRL
jgi:hypothetical protein